MGKQQLNGTLNHRIGKHRTRMPICSAEESGEIRNPFSGSFSIPSLGKLHDLTGGGYIIVEEIH